MSLIYRAFFSLGTQDKPANLEDVISICNRWLDRTYPSLAIDCTSRQIELTDGLLTSYCSGKPEEGKNEGQRYFGFKLHQENTVDRTRFNWDTTVACFSSDETLIEVTLSNSRVKYAVAPLYLVQTRPALVPMLVDQLKAYESRDAGIPLLSTPRPISENESELLVEFLGKTKRSLPVVYISPTWQQSADLEFVVNPQRISKLLAGLAYVFVPLNHAAEAQIRQSLQEIGKCFNGAVRIYWPRLPAEKDPRSRIYLFNGDMAEQESYWKMPFPEHLLQLVSRVAVTAKPFVNFDILEKTHRLSEMGKVQNIGETLAAAIKENEVLRSEQEAMLNTLRESGPEMIALYQDELEGKEEIIQDLTSQVNSQQASIGSLKEQLKDERRTNHGLEQKIKTMQASAQPVAGPAKPRFDTCFDAAVYARCICPELEFPKKAISMAKNLAYKNPSRIYDALMWINNRLVPVMQGRLKVESLAKDCQQQTGLMYLSSQTRTTMGNFEEDYFIDYRGERLCLKHHIGDGSSRSQSDTFRIAFEPSKKSNKIVVGYFGVHQRTE